jgi:hypothetical protein
MERSRRSFDSISHVTGGFIGQNTANNPTLRRLQQLAALHQRRKLFGMNTYCKIIFVVNKIIFLNILLSLNKYEHS